jgi:hypothetical protein
MKIAATLKIKRPGDMTRMGRYQIRLWFARQMRFFQKHGERMGRTYTATYYYNG